MIDKTLARMIDETLPRSLKLSGFGGGKMLEILVNQQHLVGVPIGRSSPLQCPGFYS
jgi:hypothetical protein